jgi:hypothetical protein
LGCSDRHDLQGDTVVGMRAGIHWSVLSGSL